MQIQVYSSHGEFTINEIGHIIDANVRDETLKAIDSFDVDEYLNYHNITSLPSRIDILNLGYWYKSDSKMIYEPPVSDWRKKLDEINGLVIPP